MLAQLTGNAGFQYGTYKGMLYNGSAWQITQVTLRVTAKGADGSVRWTRDFTEDLEMKPRSTGSVTVCNVYEAATAD